MPAWVWTVDGILALFLIAAFLASVGKYSHGGGHICKRCRRLTYANDDECGWCDEEEDDEQSMAR